MLSQEEKQMGMVAHISPLAGFIIPVPLLIIYFLKDNKYFQNIKYYLLLLIGGVGVYWFINRTIGIFY